MSVQQGINPAADYFTHSVVVISTLNIKLIPRSCWEQITDLGFCFRVLFSHGTDPNIYCCTGFESLHGAGNNVI